MNTLAFAPPASQDERASVTRLSSPAAGASQEKKTTAGAVTGQALAGALKLAFFAGAFVAGLAWEMAARLVKLAWRILKPMVWPPRRQLLTAMLLSTMASFAAMQPGFYGPIPQGAVATLAEAENAPERQKTAADESIFSVSTSAAQNAAVIVQTGRALGATARDLAAAIMTGLVESNLENLNHGDKSSVGIFQQKPEYWGEGGTDVATSAAKFFKGVDMADGSHTPGLFDVPGRERMPLGSLCQAVQKSAFPDRYAAQEARAKTILSTIR